MSMFSFLESVLASSGDELAAPKGFMLIGIGFALVCILCVLICSALFKQKE